MPKWTTAWLRKKFQRKPTLTPRKNRRPVVRLVPQLPYLGPYASLPQQLIAQVMNQRGIRYRPEVAQAGGRNLPGGLVVDFVLIDYNIYLRIQGDYWHGRAGQMARDDIQRIMLEARRDMRVVDIWESAIKRNPERAFDETVGVLV